MIGRAFVSMGAVLLLVAGTAVAQQAKTATGESRADQKFVQKAAEDGLAEVDLGKLASERGTSPEVKQFGEKMANDHGAANQELASLAQSKGITMPQEPDKKDQKLRDKLAKLSSSQFDREYMKAMVKDHKKDVAEFRRQSQKAKDPDVKAWASKTLPTLEGHLQLAEQTEKAVSAQAKR